MNKVMFRHWLNNQNISVKIQSDIISRLKRLENAIPNCNIEEHYINDKCSYLLSLFDKYGDNNAMRALGAVNLPIGKSHITNIKYALKKYIEFLVYFAR